MLNLSGIRQPSNNGSPQGKPAGKDGREVELRSTGTHVQWRYKGFSKWDDLIAIKDLVGDVGPKGPKGDLGEKGDQGLQGIQGIQGQTGEAGTRGLPGEKGIAGLDGLDGKDGADGREIELRVSAGYIQWRYVDEKLWKNLIALDELRGPQGKPGLKGEKGDKGERGITGFAGSQGIRGPQGFTGPAGPQGIPGDGSNLFIQETAPVTTEPVYQWWETDGSGNLVTLWVETNGA